MGRCAECAFGRAKGKCCNCGISVCRGDNKEGRLCYYTPHLGEQWGEMEWCALCCLAAENDTLIEGVRPDNDDGTYVPRCKDCNKPLKDKLSIERGYGADCWSRR